MATIRKRTYYVYQYFDSTRQETFHVGLGRGDQAYRHLLAAIEKNMGLGITNDPLDDNEVVYRIRSLFKIPVVPIVSFLATHLSRDEARRIVKGYRGLLKTRDSKKGILLFAKRTERQGRKVMRGLRKR